MVEYLLFGLVIFLVSVHYVTKIIEYFASKKKFSNNKTEFISDLYKLQQKWNLKGEFDYSQAVNITILHFSIPTEEEAKTESGKLTQKRLKELLQEEIEEHGE